MFAGKINAILTRRFAKGRDWFDFTWYAGRNISINFPYLQAALKQFDYPTPNTDVISTTWLQEQLLNKIQTLDWNFIREDVIGLLRKREQETLKLWNKSYFEHIILDIEGHA